MPNVVIIGASGHAKVVAENILAANKYKILGFVANNIERETCVLGFNVLGDDNVLESIYRAGTKYAFVAIGANTLRKKLIERVENMGFKLINAVHPWTNISPSAQIETGVAIMPGAVINAAAQIGKGTIINTNASLDHDVIIGDFCHIAPGCSIAGNVVVGNRTFLGTGVHVIDKISIGADVIIGAGAAVIRDISYNTIAVGVPAVEKNFNV
ncbi:MAG: hypothetical protein RLZ12_613 [Bacillota bacterium]|jgi:UDP-perosamine 4-acetyltransferase